MNERQWEVVCLWMESMSQELAVQTGLLADIRTELQVISSETVNRDPQLIDSEPTPDPEPDDVD